MNRYASYIFVALSIICLSGCALSRATITPVDEPVELNHSSVAVADSTDSLSLIDAADSDGTAITREMIPTMGPEYTPGMLDRWISDQGNFYSRHNLPEFVLVLGAHGLLAHTTMDQEFADWYQQDVRNEFSDDLSSVFKEFGEQWQVVPIYVGASCLGRVCNMDPRVAMWGDRSFRSMLVGVPPLLLLQRALGSSRPNDSIPSSNWHWWADENGASGHTLVGAVPFLVAAQLTDRRLPKASLYFASTLTGWSRINDNDHYLSQVIMGWWLAHTATRAVAETDREHNLDIVPLRIGGASGLGLEWKY